MNKKYTEVPDQVLKASTNTYSNNCRGRDRGRGMGRGDRGGRDFNRNFIANNDNGLQRL